MSDALDERKGISSVKNYIKLLERGDKLRFTLNLSLNLGLSLIDLLGVIFIGLLGSVVTLGIQDQEAGGLTRQILKSTGLVNVGERDLIIILVCGAILAFSLKSLFSIFVLRRVTIFFEERAAELSLKVLRDYLHTPGANKRKNTSSQVLFAFGRGIQSIFSHVIAGTILLLGDVILTLVLLAGLFFADPVMALLTILYFLLLAVLLYRATASRLARLGQENSELYIRENQLVREISSSYKRIHAEGLEDSYIAWYRTIKKRLTRINAHFAYNSLLTKIIFEIGMILGVAAIILSQFLSNTISTAVALTSVFIAASLRIGPAILRIQQQIISIRTSHQSAIPVWRLIKIAQSRSNQDESFLPTVMEEKEFVPRIEFVNVSFSYDEAGKVVSDFNLAIEPGEHAVIIGKSGGGKTTLLDLLTGFLEPDTGLVTISGLRAGDAIKTWRGRTAYISQETYLEKNSIFELFGIADDEINKQKSIFDELQKMGLADLFFKNGKIVDRSLGEDGNLLSGGQRQRLILARALYNRPRLLLLDEATSALDYASQFEINRVIRSLDEGVTVVSVTHRLESVSYFDKLIELDENGRYQVLTKEEIPEFVKQKYIFD